MKTHVAMELLRSALCIGVVVFGISVNGRAAKVAEDSATHQANLAVCEDQRLQARADKEECKATLEQAVELIQMMRDRLKACYAGEFK